MSLGFLSYMTPSLLLLLFFEMETSLVHCINEMRLMLKIHQRDTKRQKEKGSKLDGIKYL